MRFQMGEKEKKSIDIVSEVRTDKMWIWLR